MEKNKQPLIIAAIVIGVALIVVLALIFTRGDSSKEEAVESDVVENEENSGDEEENGQPPEASEGSEDPEQPENSENPEEPKQTETPEQSEDSEELEQPEALEQPENPGGLEIPEQPENPEPGALPLNWNSLTFEEKTALNPFGCDFETQIMYAEDGSCHDKPSVPPTEPAVSSLLRFDGSANASGSALRCSFFYNTEGNPDDDNFVWDECGITLRFEATADVDQSTDLSGRPYLYRTDTTDADGKQCLALNREFIQFTFDRGEDAETETYFSNISQAGFEVLTICQTSHSGGLGFTEMKKGELYNIRFYIRGKTTAEMKQRISITIQSNLQVTLDVVVEFAKFRLPVR